MNQNALNSNSEENKREQPIGLKTKRDIEKKLNALGRFEKIHGKSAETILERGKIYIEKGKPELALQFLKNSLEIKKSLETIHKLAICYGQLNRYDEASELFEECLPDFKWSGAFWCLLAYYKKKAGDNNAAHGAAHTAIAKFDQDNPEVWRILHNAGLDIQQYELNYQLSKKYINKRKKLDVSLVETYIGNCLHLGEKHSKEAVLFLEKTEFDWKKNAILTGLAAQIYYTATGDTKKALKLNEQAILLNPNNINLNWNLSLTQLRAGKLSEGLKNYEIRFSWPDFPSPRRVFNKPHWHPDIDKNSKIMLWWEQGIGDQLRFFSAIKEFKNSFPNLILETTPKTLDLIKVAYPEFVCRTGNFDPENLTSFIEDFDYHLPIGSAFGYEASKHIEKFNDVNFSLGWEYLKSDKLRTLFWRDKLNNLSTKPKIGFCWKSGNTAGGRRKQYTDLNQWKKLLLDNRFSFVNLQYDLSHQQFISKYPYLEETFLDTGHLDQKDDLEGTLSLISNLDLVLSPGSAPSMISSCIGIPTIVYATSSIHWFGRIGKFDQHPIYKNTKIYHSHNPSEDKQLIEDLVEYIDKNLNSISFPKSHKK
jgi:tetratricopeptide (TPR) repeat protein